MLLRETRMYNALTIKAFHFIITVLPAFIAEGCQHEPEIPGGLTYIYVSFVIAMSIFNLFKRQKETWQEDIVLQASATLYPDKILIETIDRAEEGFGISSSNISILPVDTDNNSLGSAIRQHLNATRTGLKRPTDYKKHYQDFLDKAGFKNGKEHHRNALHVTMLQRLDTITLNPTRNGGYTGKDRGFLGIKDSGIIVPADIDDSTLAEKIKEAWGKCVCNCV